MRRLVRFRIGLFAVAVAASVVPAIGMSQAASADTGGYPWAGATCQTSTQSYNGVAYCPNDNWVYNGGLYDTWGYNYRNCTSWVAWRLSTNNGYAMPRAIGDASAWGGYFSSHGVAVNSTPAVGAIAWESGGDHVAYVEAINGSNVTISEYNEHYYPGNTTEGDGLYETRTVSSGAFEYIHVKDLGGGGGGGGGGGAPPPPYNTNLLSNASFEDGNFTSWGTDPVNGGTVNTAAYNNPSRSTRGILVRRVKHLHWVGVDHPTSRGLPLSRGSPTHSRSGCVRRRGNPFRGRSPSGASVAPTKGRARPSPWDRPGPWFQRPSTSKARGIALSWLRSICSPPTPTTTSMERS